MKERNNSVDNINQKMQAKIPGQSLQEKLDRFRKTMHSVLNTTKKMDIHSSNKKRTDTSQDGTFDIGQNLDTYDNKGRKIKGLQTVNYNFKRKHQIAKETSDIPLSVLIKENQNKAVRDLVNIKHRQSKLEEER